MPPSRDPLSAWRVWSNAASSPKLLRAARAGLIGPVSAAIAATAAEIKAIRLRCDPPGVRVVCGFSIFLEFMSHTPFSLVHRPHEQNRNHASGEGRWPKRGKARRKRFRLRRTAPPWIPRAPTRGLRRRVLQSGGGSYIGDGEGSSQRDDRKLLTPEPAEPAAGVVAEEADGRWGRGESLEAGNPRSTAHVPLQAWRR